MSDMIVPRKRCSKCGEEKPATPEYFHKGKSKADGLHVWCKECALTYKREVTYPKQGHKKYEPIVVDGMRRCAGCKEWKPLNAEHFNRNASDKYGFGNYCRPCKNAKDIAHSRKIGRKPQRVLARSDMRMCTICERWLPNTFEFFQPSPSGRGVGGTDYRCRECQNARRRELDRLNPGRKSNYDKRYRAKYPDKVKASRHQRLARELSLPEEYEASDWRRALDYFGGCCAVCGRPPGLWHTLSPDHWISLTAADCPGTIPKNIIPLCHGVGGCNNSKSNRNPIDWLIWKFGKRKANKIRKRIEAYFEWLDK